MVIFYDDDNDDQNNYLYGSDVEMAQVSKHRFGSCIIKIH